MVLEIFTDSNYRLYTLSFFTILTISQFFETSFASLGDRHINHVKCMQWCFDIYCSKQGHISYMQSQPLPLRLLQWTCPENCDHECMWKTVDWFISRNLSVPQFHGKWPFVRILGIQEPASVVFSILNGLACFVMFMKFRMLVSKESPMYYVWQGLALFEVNAWVWSTIFHSRDNAFTEFMDYTCAFLPILYNLFAFVARVTMERPLLRIAAISVILIFYCDHVYYMTAIHFDYGYNLKVNISFGIIQATLWILWGAWNYKIQPYAWKNGASFVITLVALVTLEWFDFPPIFWVFDAHSLWHASTIAVHVLYWDFCIEDCHYMLKEKKRTTFDKELTELYKKD